MKITVVGATGQIGSRVASLLTADGHEVVSASLSSGANVLTGDGLVEALTGSNVVIDVVNSPSFEDGPVMDFFTAAARNLIDAANQTGVGHYVALSIVGADGLPDSGYMRAKVAQENIITESGLPYTIVRATQFQEFAESITDTLVVGDEVRVPDARIQLIAADDVSAQVAQAGEAEPRNGIINIGGPEKFSFAEMAQAVLDARGDDKTVVVDPDATYFGTPVDDFSLVTGDDGVLTQARFADWIARR
ncbi:SDR family oxidoreductase [Mycobacteroides franklinii]|uniref:NmrA-like family protein n=1 Tax=Mycobacteroides franklinii TaxID=948102 RepID=A0A4R8R1U3_9MYCO|nr:SDR family oxidoreductase [Mycobacteroides franklinii]TDZ42972.1 NmrA-like family protein [Mycobacteroides franklinii]TDZ50106.1 NmrA-like family protein [Mycobacteroides franklinii]TDZ56527.1 NmrA-like family protein [Mycobacteroides franklinii]TDZ63468.1 NmrA-like family protein [Mycobacteroides franklinii]TDZ69865.1 NmrA-like family protein [Mycobacteroides franklinii]